MSQEIKTKPPKQGGDEKAFPTSSPQIQTIKRDGGTYQLRRLGGLLVETRIA